MRRDPQRALRADETGNDSRPFLAVAMTPMVRSMTVTGASTKSAVRRKRSMS
jgi:hypothetical protein